MARSQGCFQQGMPVGNSTGMLWMERAEQVINAIVPGLMRLPGALAFLVSDDVAFCTGQVMNVDGRRVQVLRPCAEDGSRRTSHASTPPIASTTACNTMAGHSERVSSTMAVKTRPNRPVRMTPVSPW